MALEIQSDLWNNGSASGSSYAPGVGVMSEEKSQKTPATRSKPPSNAVRDRRLMMAISERRDPKALAQIFEFYGPKLKGWLMSRGMDAGSAEDVLQDVMIRVWTRAETFDPERASFVTWVYRLTRNRWIDHKRKHSRMDIKDPEVMNVIADDVTPSTEDTYFKSESALAVRAEIELLKPEQRELILLAFMRYMTHVEIAEHTGLPLGTVKTRLRGALKTLKNKIGRDLL